MLLPKNSVPFEGIYSSSAIPYVLLVSIFYGSSFWIGFPIVAELVGPQEFGGSGENGYLFSGSWGALVIILGELGNKLKVLGI